MTKRKTKPPNDRMIRLSVNEATYQRVRQKAFREELSLAAWARKVVEKESSRP